MARVLIDNSYLLKMTPTEAGVLRALLSIAVIDERENQHLTDAKRTECENALIDMHEALTAAGVEEPTLSFAVWD